MWCPLPTLLMGGTSFLGPETRQFESGMPRVVPHSAVLSRGTLSLCSQLFALPVGRTSYLDLAKGRLMCRTHFHTFPPKFLLHLFWLNGQTQRAGSETPWAAYSIGYPRTVARASIHLLSSQSLSHILFGPFLFNLMSFVLERLGPEFSTPHSHSLSLFSILFVWCIVLVTRWS